MPFKWGQKRIKSVLPTQSSSSETTSQNLVEVAGAVSQPEIVELSYEYTIPDLSLVAQKPGECVFSPIFFAKSHPGIQWRLIICPNGKNERSKGHLSLFLGRVFNKDNLDDNLPVSANFKLVALRNGKELESLVSEDPSRFTLSTRYWGNSKFISQDKLKGNHPELKITCSLVVQAKRICFSGPSWSLENGFSNAIGNQQQVVELNYDWVVEEPIFLPQTNGECFYSPIFFAKANDKIRWQLKMCPKGVNEDSKGFLSLYLERVAEDIGAVTSILEPQSYLAYFFGRVIGNQDSAPSVPNIPPKPVTVKSKWLVLMNGKEIFKSSFEPQTLGVAPLPSHFGCDKVVQWTSIQHQNVPKKALSHMKAKEELTISCQLVYTI